MNTYPDSSFAQIFEIFLKTIRTRSPESVFLQGILMQSVQRHAKSCLEVDSTIYSNLTNITFH